MLKNVNPSVESFPMQQEVRSITVENIFLVKNLNVASFLILYVHTYSPWISFCRMLFSEFSSFNVLCSIWKQTVCNRKKGISAW